MHTDGPVAKKAASYGSMPGSKLGHSSPPVWREKKKRQSPRQDPKAPKSRVGAQESNGRATGTLNVWRCAAAVQTLYFGISTKKGDEAPKGPPGRFPPRTSGLVGVPAAPAVAISATGISTGGAA